MKIGKKRFPAPDSQYRRLLKPGELNVHMLAEMLGVPPSRIHSLIAAKRTRGIMAKFVVGSMTLVGGQMLVFSRQYVEDIRDLIKLTERRKPVR
jgi:hypothetical protein